MKLVPRRPLAHSIVALLTLTFATTGQAALDTWLGNTSVNWNDLNWSGGNNPPIDGDSLTFDVAGTSGTNLNNNLAAGFNVSGITFNATASPYTFAGNAITLTGTGPVVNNSSSLQTINLPITLNATQTFTTTGTGGDITLGGVLSGPGGLAKASSATAAPFGTLTLANTQNTFTGEIIFGPVPASGAAQGGIINIASLSDYGVPSSIGARTAAQENNTVTGIGLHFRNGTLQYTGSTPQSTNREIRILNGLTGGTIDASGSVPEATLSFTHTGTNINLFDTAGPRTLTLTGTNTGKNSFSIQVTNQSANLTSLQKAGTGTWYILNSDNTYTGETIFAGGILNVASLSDYGVVSSIGGRTLANENTTVTGVSLHFQGGTLQYTGSTPQSTNRNIRFLNGNGATLDASGSTPTATLSFTHTGANINLFDTPGTRTLTLTGTNTGANSFSILIADQALAATSLLKTGTGTWILNGPDTNTATGSTTVTGGTLVLGKTAATAVSGALIIGDSVNQSIVQLGGTGGNQITDSAVVSLSGSGISAGILRMSNLNETVAGLNSFDGGVVENESGVAGTATLTVNVPTGSFQSYVGNLRNGDGVGIDGTLAFTKTGAGTQNLAGITSHTGATTVNGGTLSVDGTLGSGTTVTVSNATLGGLGTIAAPVNIGTGGILNMTGTLTGSVTLGSGGVMTGISTGGAVTALGGSRISPGSPTTAGTLTVSSLTLSTGALFDFEFGATSDLVVISNAGGLALNGGAFNLFATGGVTPLTTNGTYTLLDYATNFTGSLSNLSIANSQIGKFYTIANNAANTTITLTIADTTVSEWNGGAANGLWTTSGNWTNVTPNIAGAVAKLGTIPTTPTTIAVNGPKTVGGILFDNANSYTITGAAADTITLNNGVAAASISVNSGNHSINAPLAVDASSANFSTVAGSTLSVGGNISGAKGVIVSGAGTVVLTGNNSYSTTTINAGTLQIGNGGTLLGTLGTGDVTIASGGTLVLNRSDSFTVANNILGGGAQVTKLGAGTLTLTGTNTFASADGSGFNINAGTVKLGSANALVSGVVLNINGGSLDLNGNSVTSGGLTGTTGTITDGGAGAGTSVFTVNQATDSTFAGTITNGASRSIAVAKGGTGTLTLSGNNTFSGALTITNGAVIAAGDAGKIPVLSNVTLGDGSNPVFLIAALATQQFGAGTVLNFNNGAKNAKLQLRGTSQTIAGLDSTADPSTSLAIIQNDEAGTPGYTADPGVATLTLNTLTDHSFAGLIRNQAGGGLNLVKEGPATQEIRNILVTTDNFNSVTVNNGKLLFTYAPNGNNTNTFGALTTSIVVNTNGTLAFDGTVTVPVQTIISGPGTIVKQGTGTLTINSANTFTKGTTLNDGTIGIGNNQALGDPAAPVTINGGNIRASGAARDVANPIVANGNFILGRLTNLNGGITLTKDVTVTADNPDGVANNPSNLSVISGPFRVSFAQGVFAIGTGAIVLNGINTNSGGTTMLSGRVNVNGALANADLTVNGGELNFFNATQEVTGLSGTGGTTNLNGTALNITQAGNSTYSGVFGLSGTVTKQGAGTLTLGGASPTFFGSLNVGAGTLLVNGNLSGSLTTVNGGKLGGTGTVGFVSLDSGALTPGVTTGILNTGSVSLNGGSVEFTINGLTPGADYDQLNVAGSVTLQNVVQLVLSVATPLVGGEMFTLVNNDGVDPVTTTALLAIGANTLTEGEQFAVGAQQFKISYAGGLDNNDIVLLAIPEPASAAGTLTGLGLLLGFRRRRSAAPNA